jgi:hypothetical protein
MKWFLVIYLVTWKTFDAVYNPYWEKEPNTGKCELKSMAHQEEYQNWFHAARRAAELKQEPANYDVKTWEYQEPQKKEIK